MEHTTVTSAPSTTMELSTVMSTVPSTHTSPEMSTLTPEATPTTTKVPLVCNNEGLLQNGVCLCPDEWTGVNCSTANVCEKATLNNFTFPKTVIGWSAYSEQKCGPDTMNPGISKATARCMNSTAGQVEFDDPQEIDCGLTLGDLLANISGPIDQQKAQQLATSTQMLTSNPAKLTSSAINSAAMIVNRILVEDTLSNITKETATSVVTTVSQLLSADPNQYSETTDSTMGLAKSIDNLSLKPIDGLMSLVVQPKLVIQTTQVNSHESQGIQFSALSGASSSTFTANRIQVNSNASEMTPSEIPSEVEIFIKCPSATPNTNITIGFALYENDVFFQSKSFKPFKPSSGTSMRVISGSMAGAKAEHVELNFKPMNVSDKVLHDFACVFWDNNISDWSTEGCNKLSFNLSILKCRCNHTTNFAVIMSLRAITGAAAEALNWISKVGCALSILGLSITLVYQIMTRKSRRNAPTVLLVCLCSSMIIYNLTFVVGIANPEPSKSEKGEDNGPDNGTCTLVTVLLQYFLLATFSFNTLYAADLFMQLRQFYQHSYTGRLTIIYMILGWGFPAVMVAISLGVSYRVDDPLNYRQDKVCWLAATDDKEKFDFRKPMLWGFLVPMSAMLLFNAYVLIYFAYTSRQSTVNSFKQNAALKKKLLSNFSLGIVLGLSWVLGYLVLAFSYSDGLNIFLNFAFCLLVSTQGVQIFILFTARARLFRKATSRAMKSISGISMNKTSKRKGSLNTDTDGNGVTSSSYGMFTGTSETRM
ncbi:adhesion G-protein coupled receptor G7-like isoform X1 [Alosa sapidissima]|uniref:adhesion G-protein coupled receptor G7-like isoform X1 n=1 Tax=Alosa sapidissima TaxID=34773 RepID=UPI001C0988F9|nr:adhesion G-protein coupled receptor G7-like isoform X1 [Alosa sapidissima]